VIRPVPIVNIVGEYLIRIQWFTRQECAWCVLLAAWWLNFCPDIVATVQRGTLTSALHLLQAGCLRFGAIGLIPKGTAVIPPPIVHLVMGFVKY
jgi:hypothetical protein